MVKNYTKEEAIQLLDNLFVNGDIETIKRFINQCKESKWASDNEFVNESLAHLIEYANMMVAELEEPKNK